MAEDAYEYLSELLNSEYNEKIQEIKHARYDISLASDVRAVESFNFNPIPYYILLEQLCPGVLGDDNFLTDLPEELVREIQARQNIAAPNQASGNDTLDSANDVIAGVACLAVGYSMELRYDDQTMKTVMSADENDIKKEIEELIENS